MVSNFLKIENWKKKKKKNIKIKNWKKKKKTLLSSLNPKDIYIIKKFYPFWSQYIALASESNYNPMTKEKKLCINPRLFNVNSRISQ